MQLRRVPDVPNSPTAVALSSGAAGRTRTSDSDRQSRTRHLERALLGQRMDWCFIFALHLSIDYLSERFTPLGL